MSDESIITPIGRPREGETSTSKRSLRRDVDVMVAFAASLTALLTFGLSAYFFYGFTQTDQGFWTLVSAFGLCFGLGALAYGPCVYLARTARHSVKGQAMRKGFALALLLMLPWVCVSLIFIFWSVLPKIYGSLALILSTSFCVWAFKRMMSASTI